MASVVSGADCEAGREVDNVRRSVHGPITTVVNWPALIIIKYAIVQHHFCEILQRRFMNNRRASSLWRHGIELSRKSIKVGGDSGEEAAEWRELIRTDGALLTKSQLPQTVAHVVGLTRISSRHMKVCFILYAFFAIKIALVSLITNGALGEDLDWLDCYLLGRLRFPGKANKIGNAIGFGLIFLSTCTRLHLAWLTRSEKLNFPSLEFLLSDQQEITDSQIPIGPAGRGGDATKRHAVELVRKFRSQGKDIMNLNVNLHLHLKDKLLSTDRGQQEQQRRDGRNYRTHANDEHHHHYWILRANRTYKCWLILTRFSNWSAYCLVVILFLVVTTSPLTFGGSIMTDFGFELAYPKCVAWIQKQQSLGGTAQATGHIYRVEPTNKVLAYETPIDDLPVVIKFASSPQIVFEWRLYNIARIAMDFFELYAIYLECVFQLTAMTFFVLLNTIDVVLNYSGISRQLEGLIRQLVEHKDWHDMVVDRDLETFGQDPNRRRSRSRSLARGSLLHQQALDGNIGDQHKSSNQHLDPPCSVLSKKQLVREITRAQALLYDHFRLVRGYNQFNNFTLATNALHWFLYTITVIAWIPSIKSNKIVGDFYLYEICGTCFVLFLLLVASVVHSRNVLLYRQITRLMALDETSPFSKLRWTNLMNFYFPEPLFCFTLYGNTGIGRIFCVKLVTWVTSAFVLMDNFFHAVRN